MAPPPEEDGSPGRLFHPRPDGRRFPSITRLHGDGRCFPEASAAVRRVGVQSSAGCSRLSPHHRGSAPVSHQSLLLPWLPSLQARRAFISDDGRSELESSSPVSPPERTQRRPPLPLPQRGVVIRPPAGTRRWDFLPGRGWRSSPASSASDVGQTPPAPPQTRSLPIQGLVFFCLHPEFPEFKLPLNDELRVPRRRHVPSV